MRMAYVCADPGIPVFGCKGASVHVQEVIRALARRGMEVHLFATRLGGQPPAGLESIRVHPLPPIPKGDLATREEAALAANTDLRIALEGAGPFDFVYERYALWSFAGMAYAHACRIPGLLEVNAPLIEEQARHRGLSNRRAATWVASRAFGLATALLAVSKGVANYLEQWPAARGRIHVVPNGVDPHRFRPQPPPAHAPSHRFTVGFVGTLKPWHGLHILADDFAILHYLDPMARLLLVGDGPERAPLLERLSHLGLTQATHFTGTVAPDTVPQWISQMDVAVAPYPDLEDFYFSPLKVLEYMAAGVPVVASRIGQLSQLIQDGVNGLLCPPGDEMALAHALRKLRLDADLRQRLGAAGRATILCHHTWDTVASRILDLALLSRGTEGLCNTGVEKSERVPLRSSVPLHSRATGGTL